MAREISALVSLRGRKCFIPLTLALAMDHLSTCSNVVEQLAHSFFDLCNVLARQKQDGVHDESLHRLCSTAFNHIRDDYQSILLLRATRRVELKVLEVLQCAESRERLMFCGTKGSGAIL